MENDHNPKGNGGAESGEEGIQVPDNEERNHDVSEVDQLISLALRGLVNGEEDWDILGIPQWSVDMMDAGDNLAGMYIPDPLLDSFHLGHTAQLTYCQMADQEFQSAGGFTFLSRFTSATGLANCFECGTLFERQNLVKEHLRMQQLSRCHSGAGTEWYTALASSQTYPQYRTQSSSVKDDFRPQHESVRLGTTRHPPSTVSVDAFSMHVFSNQRQNLGLDAATSGVMASYGFTDSESHWSRWSSDELALKTHEIVASIQDITCSKPRGSKIALNWSPLLQSMCYDFFSPTNLRKFLLLFWCCWYPNCPIIHKPTFVVSTASPMLVTSMILIGACLSPDSRDHAGANVWLTSVEELVFSEDALYDHWYRGSTDSPWDRMKVFDTLQIVQAAYLVCLLQVWEGSQESKRRIRRHRSATTIAVG